MAEAADASPIKNVADTALWVATYRAQESERPDALFHDRQAGLLAGERGRAIAAAVPYPAIMAWILVIRTVALDRLIHKAISLGIDTVVNLGAGLDTRPYRLKLPPSLRWIEVDFTHMLDYKSEKLASETPVCRLERISADLSDRALRRSLFERIGSECRSVLIITEGLIPYLSNDEAESLSKDLFAIPSFHFWLQDYRQGGTKQWVPRRVKRLFKDAPFKFNKEDWLSFFPEQGWTIEENILAYKESLRVKRPFPVPFPWNLLTLVIPGKMQEKWRRASGYVMYKK
jgi:methyltransferase (TIGR00027 family)